MDKPTSLARIVGVEEHVYLPELMDRLPGAAFADRGFLSRDAPFGKFSLLDKMGDTEGRLPTLDAAGLSVQVLSYPLPGAHLLPPPEGVAWARDTNTSSAGSRACRANCCAGTSG